MKKKIISHEILRKHIGEKIRLDAGFSNSSIVTLVSLTPKNLFAIVKDENGTKWDVMSYRLSIT